MATTERSSGSADDETLARVLAFMRENAAKTADAVRPIEAGWVLSTPSLPAVWVMNHVRVAAPLPFDSLVDLADEELAGSRYVQITLENQDAGPTLEAEFRHAGWRTERELLMLWSAAPDREADASIVVDADEDEVLELMKRWYGEDEVTAAALEQLVQYSRREGRACGDRPLGVRAPDGQLVAISKLRGDG